jgi:hypothetical protein
MISVETLQNSVGQLFELSKSDGEDETIEVFQKVNELFFGYDPLEPDLRIKTVYGPSEKINVPWKAIIASAVAWFYRCYHHRIPDTGTYVFNGAAMDVYMAGEMFMFLIRSIERMTKKSVQKNVRYQYRDFFKYGASG